MMTETRTDAEIDDLKRQWYADPCWDIEATEGFEAHRDELLGFRVETEEHWGTKRLIRLEEKAASLGCPGNRALAAYIERLEDRIEALERRLDP